MFAALVRWGLVTGAALGLVVALARPEPSIVPESVRSQRAASTADATPARSVDAYDAPPEDVLTLLTLVFLAGAEADDLASAILEEEKKRPD